MKAFYTQDKKHARIYLYDFGNEVIYCIGFLLFTGYHKLPQEELYWSLDPNCNTAIMHQALSRQRFRDMKINLHLQSYATGRPSAFALKNNRPRSSILQHFLKRISCNKKRRCRQCYSQTRFLCGTCDVPLHQHCNVLYHKH